MIIKDLKDFVDLINYIADTNSSEKSTQQISTEGLSKFKDTLYEVLQYIDKSISPDSLTPQKRELYSALCKLNSQERNSLSQAMLTSYFTPNYIVDALSRSIHNYWENKNLENFNICEPSAGSGKFIKPFLNNNTKVDAVELDSFTAKILKNNYPYENVKIFNSGYEDFKAENLYDLIIGNAPFGNFSVYDSHLSKEDREIVSGKIHNYFFIKSLNDVKPGGIVALITTSSMNNNFDGKEIREKLVNEMNLISCVRFSDQTFKESRTKVVGDLLVFQKPLTPKKAITDREAEYVETTHYMPDNNMFYINKFLLNNPENILGDLYTTTGVLGRNILSVQENPSDNYHEKLSSILESDFRNFGLERLMDIEIQAEKNEVRNKGTEAHDLILKTYPFAEPGNIIFLDNSFQKIIVSSQSISLLDKVPMNVSPKDYQKLSVLIELRDTYKKLRFELRENNIPKATLLQQNLNEQYDLFLFVGDNINTVANSKLLASEIDADLLKGLEIFQNGVWNKSEIFSRNFESLSIEEPKIQSIEDSIALSFQKFGRLDNEYISSVYKKDFTEWAKDALNKELLYINPVIKGFDKIEGFELAVPSKFLSGYVEGKLSIYQNTALLHTENKLSDLFDKNVIDKAKEALIKAIPFKLNIAEINPGMGEPWVDNSIYELFAKEHFNTAEFSINHISAMDKFKISGSYSSFANANYSVETNSNRVNYLKIFEYAMIHNIPEYKKEVMRGEQKIRVADKDTINAVIVAVEKLNSAFTNWLMQKTDLCEILENKYHLLNNAIVKENFNVSLLNFDDVTMVKPYDHQKNAVWQNVNQLGGIIDHEVGFGKSLTMAMTTMKKIQFGLTSKELIAGLNANYVAIYETYKAAYPKGKFLLVEPDDLKPEKKQETFYKIANNNWDAVITAHSCLMKFPIAPYTQKEILQEVINEIKNTVNDSDVKKLLTRGETNALNKKLTDAEAKYKYANDVINSRKESGTLIFDDLGFNSMTIDESQEFKNLSFTTKHTRVAGLGNQDEVQKTTNLLSYVRHIQGIHKGDKGITFASGTTISNSITELYLLFKYLRPEMLKEKGMNNFDQWARVFARKTNEYEENVTGMIKQKERFRYFVKVPELAKMYNDITNYADFNTFKIERPQAKTNLIAIEPYKEQLDYFERIKKFGETKNPDYLIGKSAQSASGRDIQKAVGLICTNLGRKSALSLKLIDPNFPDHPNDKINTMAKAVIDYHQKYNNDKGTQLVFCDQGVPGSVNYNLYAYIKEVLVSKGVPAHEIAFIHDWDKNRLGLFAKVNSGEIRVLIGSTSKMGIGVNVQQKICALHHLDFPWRPTDMVQRNGRAERPGNLLLPNYDNVLNVNYYATKQSLDSYTFNLLQIKHNFIMQIKNSSVSTRVIDEGLIDVNGSMNFSEYMAACSSNQYLTQKLQVEKKLNALVDKQNSYDLNFRQKTNQLSFIKDDIQKCERLILKLTGDIDSKKDLQTNMINGKTYSSEKELAFVLRNELEKKFKTKNYDEPFVNFSNGFGLIVSPKHKDVPIDKENYNIFLQTANKFKIGWKSNTFVKDDSEVANYAKNCLSRIEVLHSNETKKLDGLLVGQKEINDVLNNKIDNSDEIKSLRKEIVRLEHLIERENKKNDNDRDIDDQSKSKSKKPKL
ncbi:helicase-related protein [uncultured Flavobacterium sp.]|uniref:helicase-related protein n=1 Tax=uncultured Flavobacterium sp. TaxID=165435 RepID=UPI0025975132|nr:helicase-related protein [uncultured Flavobacterium sp.]